MIPDEVEPLLAYRGLLLAKLQNGFIGEGEQALKELTLLNLEIAEKMQNLYVQKQLENQS